MEETLERLKKMQAETATPEEIDEPSEIPDQTPTAPGRNTNEKNEGKESQTTRDQNKKKTVHRIVGKVIWADVVKSGLKSIPSTLKDSTGWEPSK